MKAAPLRIDRRVAQLGRSVRMAPTPALPWTPPPLTDLIGRIDSALRDRAAF